MMNVASDGKWFWVDPPTAPAAAAAERILSMRLDEVARYIPLAAHHDADDVEYVHQLRVSCRRAGAALRAFESLVGKRGRKLAKQLKRIRRAAGPARDADVLLERLERELDVDNPQVQTLLSDVADERREAQPALAALDEPDAHRAFRRAAERCLAGLDRAAETNVEPFAAVACATLARRALDVDELAAAGDSFDELHQLRIAAKRLRYEIEIFHGAVDPRVRSELYPQIEEVQERLGAINDHASSQLRWQRWMCERPADELAAFLAQLVVREHAAARRLREEFLAWWTPDRRAAIQDQLHAVERTE